MIYPLTTALPYIAPSRPRRLADVLGLAIILLAVTAIIWFADSGMARIRDGLAAELFEQQRDVAALELTVGRAEAALRNASRQGGSREEAAAALTDITAALVNMRRSYSFDSVEGASAAHALVYPALLDVQRWVTDGVSGYAATDQVVWELAYRRTGETMSALRNLSAEVTDHARKLLAEESAQVERLRLNLIIAILAVGLLATGFLIATMRQRNAEGRAARDRGRLMDALNNVPHGVALFDQHDHLVLANHTFSELFPGDARRLEPGQPFTAVNTVIEHARRAPDDDSEWDNDALVPRAIGGPILAETRDGRFVQIETRPTHEGGTVLVQSDVTSRRHTEQRLRHLATHDALTELAGRRHFDTRLRQALHAAERNQQALTLLYIDIDYFKQINDRLGHPIGDTVLVTIAKRLAQSVRDHDIVARLSGDEFAVVMENTSSREDALVTCRRILSDVAQPIDTVAGSVTQTVSIGVAIYPEHASSSDALVRTADHACYRAKRTGRNQVQFYEQPDEA